MNQVLIYTSALCPFCSKALWLLDKKGAGYRNISVDGRPDVRQEMTKKAGRHTVPQIWIGDSHIGGCDDLFALEASGELDKLLTP
ncbi:glutaredoxin 3 [Endozoicomonas sp. Mp262]|uniref:glutaredoxin 3 n=1 Tax=Endozoicomonas sp. Mp262 TaxID=2919499 RepID=UPI0021D87088